MHPISVFELTNHKTEMYESSMSHWPHVIGANAFSILVPMPRPVCMRCVGELQFAVSENSLAESAPRWLCQVRCCWPFSIAAVTDIEFGQGAWRRNAVVDGQRSLVGVDVPA